MKIFEGMLKKSPLIGSILKFVQALNGAVDGLVKLNESMVAEINEQKKRMDGLAKLLELLMQRDPQLMQILNKAAEKKKDFN